MLVYEQNQYVWECHAIPRFVPFFLEPLNDLPSGVISDDARIDETP